MHLIFSNCNLKKCTRQLLKFWSTQIVQQFWAQSNEPQCVKWIQTSCCETFNASCCTFLNRTNLLFTVIFLSCVNSIIYSIYSQENPQKLILHETNREMLSSRVTLHGFKFLFVFLKVQLEEAFKFEPLELFGINK